MKRSAGENLKPHYIHSFLSFAGVLILGETQVTGPIPSEIGELTQLGMFTHSFSQSGLCNATLTCCFSSVHHTVVRLFLSQSNLNGTIPSTIGRLVGLLELSFEDQDLSGSIPTELLLLTSLGKNRE